MTCRPEAASVCILAMMLPHVDGSSERQIQIWRVLCDERDAFLRLEAGEPAVNRAQRRLFMLHVDTKLGDG